MNFIQIKQNNFTSISIVIDKPMYVVIAKCYYPKLVFSDLFAANSLKNLYIFNKDKVLPAPTKSGRIGGKAFSQLLKGNLLGSSYRTYHVISRPQVFEQVFKRFYPGPNALHNVIPKVPVAIYNSNRIKQQLYENHILKKYLAKYAAHEVPVPFIVENFPTHGISGSFTLSPKERDEIMMPDSHTNKILGFTLARYAFIMYGGWAIKDVSDITNRAHDLFTKDEELLNYQEPVKHVHGIKSIFPITQHHLAVDFYNVRIPTNKLNYSSKFDLTSSTSITLQKELEIHSISKSHDFLNDQIIIIDINNKGNKIFLEKHRHLLSAISKQVEVDAVGSHTVWGTNEQVYYPIDTKLIKHQEKNLDMLSSYSSMSPNYQALEVANKLSGQLHNLNNKVKDIFLKKQYDQFKDLIDQHKKGKITKEIFELQLKKQTQEFFQSLIKNNKFVYDKYSVAPSIISDADNLSEQHHYNIIKKSNPQLFKDMTNDMSKNIKFSEHFPTMQDYRKYDVYNTQLPFLILLKKYGLIDNYYAARKLLLIQDVHDI